MSLVTRDGATQNVLPRIVESSDRLVADVAKKRRFVDQVADELRILNHEPSQDQSFSFEHVHKDQGTTRMSACVRGSTSKWSANWPLKPVTSIVWPGLRPLTSIPVEALTNTLISPEPSLTTIMNPKGRSLTIGCVIVPVMRTIEPSVSSFTSPVSTGNGCTF